MPVHNTDPEFAASLVQQTRRARNPITPVQYCLRYCPDVVSLVPPRYVHNAKVDTWEERLAISNMMLDKEARESPFTLCYFLAARDLAQYAYALEEEGLNTLGHFWTLYECDKKYNMFMEKHMVSDEDQVKFNGLLDTVDMLYVWYGGRDLLPAVVQASLEPVVWSDDEN